MMHKTSHTFPWRLFFSFFVPRSRTYWRIQVRQGRDRLCSAFVWVSLIVRDGCDSKLNIHHVGIADVQKLFIRMTLASILPLLAPPPKKSLAPELSRSTSCSTLSTTKDKSTPDTSFKIRTSIIPCCSPRFNTRKHSGFTIHHTIATQSERSLSPGKQTLLHTGQPFNSSMEANVPLSCPATIQ